MAFMVVGLHAGFLGDFTSLGQYLTVNGLFRIAVPIFLIINGFYYYTVVTKNRQANWLKRVLILYIVWMGFYSYCWFTLPYSFVGFAKLIFKFVIGYHHLWYISGMMGAAIILLSMRGLSSFILVISIMLTFLGGVLLQYLGNYHILEGSVFDKLFNYHWFHRNALLFSFPFFCTGYLINKHSLHNFLSFRSAGFISVLGLLALLGESYVNYFQEGRDGGFDNYISLLLACPFIFISFIKLNNSGKSKNIALYSSAIYFIHAFLISVFRKFTEIEQTSLTLTVIVASVIVSYFIIEVNKKLGLLL